MWKEKITWSRVRAKFKEIGKRKGQTPGGKKNAGPERKWGRTEEGNLVEG